MTPEDVAERTAGDQAAAISKLLTTTMVEYTGRGPTGARTTIGRDVVTVLLDDTFTKAERSLVRDGFAKDVVAMRRSFQRTMASTLIAGVEAITGRQVAVFLSDHHVDPDMAAEVFVLRPSGTEIELKPLAPGELDPRAPIR